MKVKFKISFKQMKIKCYFPNIPIIQHRGKGNRPLVNHLSSIHQICVFEYFLVVPEPRFHVGLVVNCRLEGNNQIVWCITFHTEFSITFYQLYHFIFIQQVTNLFDGVVYLSTSICGCQMSLIPVNASFNCFKDEY